MNLSNSPIGSKIKVDYHELIAERGYWGKHNEVIEVVILEHPNECKTKAKSLDGRTIWLDNEKDKIIN